MDENNVNGFDNMDDEEGTTVLTSPGVSAYGGAQGTPPTNMTTPDQMNGQYGGQQYGDQSIGQYGGQQYGDQSNGQYGAQQYGDQMNGQYGGQQYGNQMGNNPFAQPAKKQGFNINDLFQNTKLMIISGAALAAIIIIIVVIAVVAGGRGAGSVDTIGDQLAKAVQTGNENRVYKLTNKKALNAVTKDVGETKKETLEDISEVLEDYTDDIEDEVGKIKKIEVKDVKKNYEGKSDIKDIEKKYKRNHDLQLDISGYVSAKADITIEGKDGTADGTIYYYAVKIGNKWYLDHEKGFSVSVDSGDWNY